MFLFYRESYGACTCSDWANVKVFHVDSVGFQPIVHAGCWSVLVMAACSHICPLTLVLLLTTCNWVAGVILC